MIIFGTRYKQVKDGEMFRETCPKCGVRAVFVECVEKSSLSLLMIELLEDSRHVLVCTECQESFAMPGAKPAPREPPPPPRREEPRAAPPTPSRAERKESAASPEIAARLAALKRKMKPPG